MKIAVLKILKHFQENIRAGNNNIPNCGIAEGFNFETELRWKFFSGEFSEIFHSVEYL